MQTPDFPPLIQLKQAIRSKSDLPGVEAFDEERSNYHLLAQLSIVVR
jgi:hypothetical protein